MLYPAGLRAGHRTSAPAASSPTGPPPPHATFTKRLREAAFEVEEVTARHGQKEGKYLIWVARHG